MDGTMGKKIGWLIWTSAILLLIFAGLTYRLLASHLKLVVNIPIRLPVPLSAFPLQIGNWIGTNLPIPNTTREYMERHFADDFLSRRYVDHAANAWADVYVVYCSSRPGGMLGHQPLVCYPAHGWVHDGSETSQFVTRTGRQIPCLVHLFHKSNPMYEQIIVLNFYIINGQITTYERDFSGPLGRRPNIAGDPARYIAQVQISSVLENSAISAARDMADLILDFLPVKNNGVRVTDYTNVTSGLLK